ncbi:hypothetical protein AVEN_187989-1 [Araneus ventricosus]|uniref:Uncharacterized protein n=1 Tax=Araneus ventricosus TaxID=182803 RepID=A0A4Y2J4P0_ARAVE|nr:hypothetical protein AVEN_187989-1 [Araneus ventricosus]
MYIISKNIHLESTSDEILNYAFGRITYITKAVSQNPILKSRQLAKFFGANQRTGDYLYSSITLLGGPRWPSGKALASGRRAPGSKPDSTEEPPRMWACYTPNHTQGCKPPPSGVVQKLGEGVLAQVSSSSSGRGQNDGVRPQIALVSLQN